MIKNLLLIVFTFFTVQAISQVVILSEDFQDPETFEENLEIDPDDTDDAWVSFDSDGLADANGRPQNWYLTFDFIFSTDNPPIEPPDSNIVMGSSSWLDSYLPGNLNYLITPPIQVNSSDYTLSWKGATFQGPRYMDGYSVRINTTGDNLAEDFTDIVWEAAEMEAFGPDSVVANAPLDINSYELTPGAYIHADGFTLDDYYTLDANANAYSGLLEPHTISLAAYEGQTIYIAFVHDSDDDNLISVDDIVVEGSVGIDDKPLENMVNFFPNPVDNALNMTFTNMITNGSIFEVYDLHGRLVHAETVFPEDNPSITVDMSGIQSGLYSVRFIVDGVASQSHNIVKM